uniref:Tr-type G domain-containing protein n=1 Tax=Chrysotila carterae TaxID=13221 RepID=A0A7S4B194_CHRCT
MLRGRVLVRCYSASQIGGSLQKGANRVARPSLAHSIEGPRKSFSTNRRAQRALGIVAHIDAGKTTTTERMLLLSGTTRFAGEVDAGDTVMDYLQQERERGITIQAAATTFVWKDHDISLIDTPGHVDFTIEVERAVRVLDSAVLIVDAVAGAQAQTETVWRQARRHGLPALAFVNKLDREGADLAAASASLAARLRVTPLVVQMPIMKVGAPPTAIVDLVEERVMWWEAEAVEGRSRPQRGAARTFRVSPLSRDAETASAAESVDASAPQVDAARVRLLRDELIERVVELEEEESELSELYLNEMQVPASVLRASIRRLTLSGAAVPTLCGTSLHGIGVEPLMDAMLDYLPSPEEAAKPTLRDDSAHTQSAAADAGAADEQGRAGETAGLPMESAAEAVALAFKVVHEPSSRRPLVWLRAYHGEIRAGDVLHNSVNGSSERVSRLLRMRGEAVVDVEAVRAGEICAAMGLKHTRTGDTVLLSPSGENAALRLEGVPVPPPVFFCAVETQTSAEQKALDAALAGIMLEDPSVAVRVDRFTGQQLIGGMGELHLEVLAQRLLTEWNLKISMGAMRVAYREGITLPVDLSSFHEVRTAAGGQIEMSLALSPLDGRAQLVQQRLTVQQQRGSAPPVNLERRVDAERRVVVRLSKGLQGFLKHREARAVLDGLSAATQFGDLAGFPVHGAEVVLKYLRKPPGASAEELGAAAAEALEQVQLQCDYGFNVQG